MVRHANAECPSCVSGGPNWWTSKQTSNPICWIPRSILSHCLSKFRHSLSTFKGDLSEKGSPKTLRCTTVSCQFRRNRVSGNIVQLTHSCTFCSSVAAVAINGATNFVPEINSWLQLVDMTSAVSDDALHSSTRKVSLMNVPLHVWQFRMRLTICMILDYGGAWLVDIVLKRTLADVQPRESESMCRAVSCYR